MATVDRSVLQDLAAQCVSVVEVEFDRTLDWTADSLSELDAVCRQLLSEENPSDERLDLWWRLVGAYTGEVVIRTYGGEWVATDDTGSGYAVSVLGITARPFAIADKILRGAPDKSLASFARVLPVVSKQSRDGDGEAGGDGDGHSDGDVTGR